MIGYISKQSQYKNGFMKNENYISPLWPQMTPVWISRPITFVEGGQDLSCTVIMLRNLLELMPF